MVSFLFLSEIRHCIVEKQRTPALVSVGLVPIRVVLEKTVQSKIICWSNRVTKESHWQMYGH